jgi:tetratricopeptide (TPR) repeat protein
MPSSIVAKDFCQFIILSGGVNFFSGGFGMTKYDPYWLLCALLSLSSCAPRIRCEKNLSISRVVRKNDASQKMAHAKSLYDIGEIEAAVAHLRIFVDNNPYNPSHDIAYELLIEWLLQLKRHEEAKHLASYFISHHPKSSSVEKIIELFDTHTTVFNSKEEKSPILEQNTSDDLPNEDFNDQLLDLEGIEQSKLRGI